ncbi:MAG: amidohydrolase [bacterium]|nr:MAG: amidohydrolase [bacterium]
MRIRPVILLLSALALPFGPVGMARGESCPSHDTDGGPDAAGSEIVNSPGGASCPCHEAEAWMTSLGTFSVTGAMEAAEAGHSHRARSLAAAGSDSAASDSTKSGAKKDEESKDWFVNMAHGPSDTLRFSLTEGTWMSSDVSRDGKTIIFDLLGDLYTLPISGGRATRLTSGPAGRRTASTCRSRRIGAATTTSG